MRKPKIYLALFVISICLYSCTTTEVDDLVEEEQAMNENEVEEEATAPPTLEEVQESSVALLTNDNKKVWKAEVAELINTNGTFNVSDNFNMKDDEFIFKNSSATGRGTTNFNLTLEWRQNNTINTNANNSDETMTENYVSPEIFELVFQSNSGLNLIAGDNRIEITVSEEGVITLTIQLDGGAQLRVTLNVKLEEDYEAVPTSRLEFEDSNSFFSNAIDGYAPDIIGSLVDNSLYIATREDDLGDPGQPKPERVIKMDIASGDQIEAFSFTPDFVSKQLVINNDKLLVVGAKKVSTYNLDIIEEPTTQYYADYDDSLQLTRFGASVSDNNIYLIGGDALFSGRDARIAKFDIETGVVSDFIYLTTPLYGARGEVVNDRLYVFGGTYEFDESPATNDIYIIDTNNAEIVSVEQMPTKVDLTFVKRYGNLIYVAGSIITRDVEGMPIDRSPYLGVYNTENGSFTELETNLSSPENETIHAMTIVNDEMFLIYGQKEEVLEGHLQLWTLKSTSL